MDRGEFSRPKSTPVACTPRLGKTGGYWVRFSGIICIEGDVSILGVLVGFALRLVPLPPSCVSGLVPFVLDLW